ncbi:hypothetical protein ACFYOY_39215 [Streptomyces sp. NPDC007875]|uniref:hypothetical protein n=1 Tax=Streptomyces sp. NPDC007875 TaxID=3364783 RepID=UPI0036B69AED
MGRVGTAATPFTGIGSTIAIEVRTHDTNPVQGSRALLAGYDTEDLCFWGPLSGRLPGVLDFLWNTPGSR